MNIVDMTAVELGKKIKSGEVTSVEATKAVLDEIKKKDGDINAYITVIEEAALARAEEVQKGIEAGEFADSPLAGVPVSIKDNISCLLYTSNSHKRGNACFEVQNPRYFIAHTRALQVRQNINASCSHSGQNRRYD